MTAAEPTTAMATLYSEHVSELVVAAREPVADGVVSLVLEHPEGGELPAWTPGAHVDLLLGPDLVRQYSLCGAPADRSHWRVGVLRDESGRGGSRHVHDRSPYLTATPSCSARSRRRCCNVSAIVGRLRRLSEQISESVYHRPAAR